MKVGYVVSMFPCWSETFILNEIINHSANGVDVTIFSLKQFSEKMIHSEAHSFIPQTKYPLHLLNPYLWFLHLLLVSQKSQLYLMVVCTLLKLQSSSIKIKIKVLIIFLLSPFYINHVEKNPLDHIHAHFATYPAILAWIISIFNNTPFSVTAHAHDIYVNQDLLPIIYTYATNIFAISEFNKNFIIGKLGNSHEDKIKIVHCGINLKRFSFEKKRSQYDVNNPINILSIGRLSGIKGFSYLLRALKLLRDNGVHFNCQIIGDGPLLLELTHQTEQLDIKENIFFLGSKKTEEIPEYLKKADVFILACATSKLEGHDGIPLVFMEAMAYGVPVIGTNLSGIPELIRHEETGLCAVPEDPVSIKNQLVYFINHREKIEQMRFTARELIEKDFNIDSVGAKLRSFYSRDVF